MRPCPCWAGGKDSFVPNMGPGHKQVGKGSSMIRDSTDKNPGDLRPSPHRHREPLQGGIASYHISILLWQHNHTCWRASYQDYLSGGSLQTSQMSRWHCVEGRYAPLILGHSGFAWWETLKCSDFMYIYDKPWLYNLTFSSKHHTPLTSWAPPFGADQHQFSTKMLPDLPACLHPFCGLHRGLQPQRKTGANCKSFFTPMCTKPPLHLFNPTQKQKLHFVPHEVATLSVWKLSCCSLVLQALYKCFFYTKQQTEDAEQKVGLSVALSVQLNRKQIENSLESSAKLKVE